MLTDQATLAQLRLDLFGALVQAFPNVHAERPPFGWPQLAFADIIRFTYADRYALVKEVAQLRVVRLGRMVIDGSELVLTDKVPTVGRTTSYTTLLLQPDEPPPSC